MLVGVFTVRPFADPKIEQVKEKIRAELLVSENPVSRAPVLIALSPWLTNGTCFTVKILEELWLKSNSYS